MHPNPFSAQGTRLLPHNPFHERHMSCIALTGSKTGFPDGPEGTEGLERLEGLEEPAGHEGPERGLEGFEKLERAWRTWAVWRLEGAWKRA